MRSILVGLILYILSNTQHFRESILLTLRNAMNFCMFDLVYTMQYTVISKAMRSCFGGMDSFYTNPYAVFSQGGY